MLRLNFLKSIAGMIATVGVATASSGNALQDMPDMAGTSANSAVVSPTSALSPDNASDVVSVQLGAYHLVIPKAYFARGAFSVQTTDHLVLDIHLPDIRPLTTEEQEQFAKTGLMSRDTAHVILEAGDHYGYGESLLEAITRDKPVILPSSHYITPQQSEVPTMVVYRGNFEAQDVYLVKGSSPKFFFECNAYDKFGVNYTCKYHDRFIGGTHLQIWYDKKRYLNDIVALTPKIKALLLTFVRP